MKIEKVSDTQIKFILTKEDLLDRDIHLDELSAPSDKTQELFRDIMDQAMEECDFISDDAPLMVEAVPIASGGIMIIVTKISNNDSINNKFTLFSQNKNIHKFKRKPLNVTDESDTKDSDILIYSFDCLDDVIKLSLRLNNIYFGTNELYKYDKKYFLMLQNDVTKDIINIDDLAIVLNEYGEKHVSGILSKYYLVEHGELLVNSPAIKTLAKTFA